MHIKLRLFKLESTISRYINVVLDGEEVLPKTEIVSTDESNPDEFIIQTGKIATGKAAGIYTMIISVPDHSFEDDGAIVLSQLFVSGEDEDSENWKDYIVNGSNTDGSSLIGTSVKENRRVRIAKHIWNFWYGDEAVLNIEIPTGFNGRFPHASGSDAISFVQEKIDLLPDGSVDRAPLEEQIAKLSVLL